MIKIMAARPIPKNHQPHQYCACMMCMGLVWPLPKPKKTKKKVAA